MNELLLFCTKNVPFMFDNDVYQQRDGVAAGFPLGPAFPGIIMVDLEKYGPLVERSFMFLEKVCWWNFNIC